LVAEATAGPVVVGNARPEITSVLIAPDVVTADSGALCSAEASDPDGDPTTIELLWLLDGSPLGSGPRTPAGELLPGDTLTCSATPSDGLEIGETVLSEPVVVAGSSPEAPFVRVHPASPWAGEGLWCLVDVPAWDADGDPVAYEVEWTVDGVLWSGPVSTLAHPGDTIAVGQSTLGQRWQCDVTVSDVDGEAAATAHVVVGEAPGGNVLVILADDLGVDKVGAYAEHPEPPPTPVIDGLASTGMLFRHATASPSCSPTRASLLTGRYPRRTGVGEVVRTRDDAYMLPLDELLIPEILEFSPLGYTSVALGKWHLAGNTSPSGLRHPLDQGFVHHAGSFGNPGVASQPPDAPLSYFYWEKVTDGVPAFVEAYMTTDTVDDAIAQIASLPEPWFLYVALNAPHDPFHLPPPELHSFDLDESAGPSLRYAAMVEAMDTELGRLLESTDPEVLSRTTVVFAGDNGSHERVIRPPHDPARSKTTLYEGGVNVPLIVSGPLVAEPGSESTALVHIADLFATMAEIAGVRVHPPGLVEPAVVIDALETDGHSLLPLLAEPGHPGFRRYAWSEKFAENGLGPYITDGRTIRDDAYKLITYQSGAESFFDLAAGTWDEGPPVTTLTDTQHAARARLREALSAQVERLTP
jgi:arylsulfatase A-like enzyme